MGGFFNNDRTLPMYKDKPYFAPRRTAPRRRLGAVLKVLGVFTVILLWYYYKSGAPSWQGPASSDKGVEFWRWLQSLESGTSAKEKPDWELRREKARDAFLVSWDGYEREAWGKMTQAAAIAASS
ncbi:Glycoside hydrolase family 47 [Penicillium capsulatum]|uniref:Glycoside hydrolase family 47 n=1 Tax=Penicillium capsulatum TaxID=69766 RepID=A0A9W9LR67_9EURO|nr:Glycoside hydrolase family 47 [Penicillium capsulatum]